MKKFDKVGYAQKEWKEQEEKESTGVKIQRWGDEWEGPQRFI